MAEVIGELKKEGLFYGDKVRVKKENAEGGDVAVSEDEAPKKRDKTDKTNKLSRLSMYVCRSKRKVELFDCRPEKALRRQERGRQVAAREVS